MNNSDYAIVQRLFNRYLKKLQQKGSYTGIFSLTTYPLRLFNKFFFSAYSPDCKFIIEDKTQCYRFTLLNKTVMLLANEIAMYIDIVITLVDENVSGLQNGTLMHRWRQKRYLSRQVEGKNKKAM